MRFLAWLALIFAAPAFGEPSNFEAFDFKNCLRWDITNEMYGDLDAAPRGYVSAVKLANQQRYSAHKDVSPAERERMGKEHPYEIFVVYSALAHSMKSKDDKAIEKYGVCKWHFPNGIECLPNQDFPLSGARYLEVRSKGALPTLRCVTGCTEAPATIHNMGYENMDGERNIEQEAALKSFEKVCGRAP